MDVLLLFIWMMTVVYRIWKLQTATTRKRVLFCCSSLSFLLNVTWIHNEKLRNISCFYLLYVECQSILSSSPFLFSCKISFHCKRSSVNQLGFYICNLYEGLVWRTQKYRISIYTNKLLLKLQNCIFFFLLIFFPLIIRKRQENFKATKIF